MKEEEMTEILSHADPAASFDFVPSEWHLTLEEVKRRARQARFGKREVAQRRALRGTGVARHVSLVAAACLLVATMATWTLESRSSAPHLPAQAAIHPSWIDFAGSTAPLDSPHGVTYSSFQPDYVNSGRFTKTLHIGSMTISPAPRHLPGLPASGYSASQMSRRLWSMTSFAGQRPLAFGLGLVSLHASGRRGQVLRPQLMWVAIATPQGCLPVSACRHESSLHHRGVTVVVSNDGLATNLGSLVALSYVIPDDVRGPMVLPAIERRSLQWRAVSLIDHRLTVEIQNFPCGQVRGYRVVATTRGVSVTVIGDIGTLGEHNYCPLSHPVRREIRVGGGLDTLSRIEHAPIGWVRMVN